MFANRINTDLLYENLHDEWTYRIHPLDIASDFFGPFAPIIDMCRIKVKSGHLASWADIDFYDFVGWHGKIGLMERLDDPFDMYIRLFGTTITDHFDNDLTGKLVSKLEGETDENNQEDLKFFETICDLPGYGIGYGPANWLEKKYKHFTLLYIPLANDGLKATHLLMVMLETSPATPLLSL